MNHSLLVFHSNENVGVITLNNQNLFEFQYNNKWVELGREGISKSLPLSNKKYSAKEAHSFFSNLLPEGDVRRVLCNKLGLSVDNDYELLKAIGGECAGAFVIVERAEDLDFEESYEHLSEESFSKNLNKGFLLANYSGESGVRLSLAGAQDKMPVLLKNKKIYLPKGASPSSHILKFPSRYDKNLLHNECFMLHLGSLQKLNTVKAKLINIEGFEILAVERYDRVFDHSNKLIRLAQEDFCQIKQIHQNKKYEKEGGPNLADCVEIVKTYSDEPLIDMLRLIRWLIFNVITGNADGHGKNLSIFKNQQNKFLLTPFYDLVCTQVYSRLDKNLAMTIDGQSDPGNITGTHWKNFAHQVGLKPDFMLKEVEELAESLIETKNQAAESYLKKYSGNEIVERIQIHITKQSRRVLDQLKI